MTTSYLYSATLAKPPHDGDTCDLVLTSQPTDVGFRIHVTASTVQTCRLLGYNARELADPGGPEARDHLTAIISGKTLRVESTALDRYGRALVNLWLPDGTSVADLMVHDGYGAPWSGRGVKPTPPWPVPA